MISKPKILDPEELTIELEEVGIEIGGINNIYFYEEDITRYLTTDDYFDLRMEINGYTFIINQPMRRDTIGFCADTEIEAA